MTRVSITIKRTLRQDGKYIFISQYLRDIIAFQLQGVFLNSRENLFTQYLMGSFCHPKAKDNESPQEENVKEEC